MKNLSLLVWITQLGLSVAVPPVGFILLATWIRNLFDLGVWVVIVGAILGLVFAVDGLRSSLKAMSRMAKDKKEDTPPVSFNDHQ